MRAERRRIGRGWRKLRREGLAGLQGRTVAQYRRGEQRFVERYSAFPQRFILGAEQRLSEFEQRWLRGEYPDADRSFYVSHGAAVRALIGAVDAAAITAAVAAARLGLPYSLPRAGARRQLLEQGRAPKGRR